MLFDGCCVVWFVVCCVMSYVLVFVGRCSFRSDCSSLCVSHCIVFVVRWSAVVARCCLLVVCFVMCAFCVSMLLCVACCSGIVVCWLLCVV